MTAYPPVRNWLLARWKAIAIGGSLASFGLIGVVGLWDRKILFEAPRSFAFRAEYWKTTMTMVNDHFWLGVGPGNYQTSYATYKPPLASETIADPHNFLFETMATAGVPALLCLLVTIVSLIIVQTIRYLSNDQWDRETIGHEPLNPITSSLASTSKVQTTAPKNAVTIRPLQHPICRNLLLGGIAGPIAVWLSMGAMGPTPSVEPYLLSLPLLAFYFVYLIKSEKLVAASTSLAGPEQQLLGPTLSVIGIHLLASGGWMTPGIGNSIAVLLGLLIGSVDARATMNGSSHWSVWGGKASAILGMTLLGLFYITTWLPHQNWSIIREQLERGELTINENTIEQLESIDRWNPAVHRLRADLAYNRIASSQNRSNVGAGDAQGDWVAVARQLASDYREHDRSNWKRGHRAVIGNCRLPARFLVD